MAIGIVVVAAAGCIPPPPAPPVSAPTTTVRPATTTTVHPTTTTSTTTTTVASAEPFDITVRFASAMTTSQQAAFTAAAARWSQVITAGLPDRAITLGTNTCASGTAAFSGTVDDLLIDASIVPIDGPGGVLGNAGPCLVRTAGGLPVYGVMQFDSADMSTMEGAGLLGPVILHEMGHVLGFGTLWSGTLLNGAGTSDPTFVGPAALGVWHGMGGTGAVPVENTGGVGTADAHWRESVFGTELMTGYLDGATAPLSALTIASLGDLGYQVDLSAADAFGLAGLRAAGATPSSIQVTTHQIRPVGSV
jgi:hypothetical protein